MKKWNLGAPILKAPAVKIACLRYSFHQKYHTNCMVPHKARGQQQKIQKLNDSIWW